MKKNIEKYLNDGFEQMTPDVLSSVLKSPKEKTISEDELFSLLEEEKHTSIPARRPVYVFATAAIAAILLISLMVIRPSVMDQQNVQAAGSISIEGNCNITITYDKNGKVIDLEGETSKDKKTAKELEKKIGKDVTLYDTIDLVLDYNTKNATDTKKDVHISRNPSKNHSSTKVEKEISTYLKEKESTKTDSPSISTEASTDENQATESTLASSSTTEDSKNSSTSSAKKPKKSKKSRKPKRRKKPKKKISETTSAVPTEDSTLEKDSMNEINENNNSNDINGSSEISTETPEFTDQAD